ncbi:hypothetical protein ACH4PU_35470 [Streptomyces sp. NPDC021100]|uniref:hypothetical protein n=1 Tax=Streptomyces sp. NPDC021100 TaxID=3365114 RepID=UPI003795E87E
MFSARNRIAAALVAVAASAITLGQGTLALAAGPGDDGPSRLPVQITFPAPGKITKEHKVTNTYQYDPKSGSSSPSQEQPPASSSPSQPEPGPVTTLKDTANSAAQAVASGAGATLDAAAK